MIDKIKSFIGKELACTNCEKVIKEGEKFTAAIVMPPERKMLVGRLDKVIVKTAYRVLCEICMDK